MTRRKHRSVAAQQRRYINRLISTRSYKDKRKSENVNVLTEKELERKLVEKFGAVKTGLHLQYTRGEIVADSRGEGSLQRLIDEE